ncbi:hypothetical protein BC938DRAFT_471969 [Jimgerdemannia flammicorona]|uniref:Uncharacterized protein n=1 Tax=Jimgerdemannia flammicorona TaxID=994334 RepID=A0A433Q701_9FUNG|nr:hypothetical protein BC938DRAFT_471969 [Jimgerdemannia flammicorona]
MQRDYEALLEEERVSIIIYIRPLSGTVPCQAHNLPCPNLVCSAVILLASPQRTSSALLADNLSMQHGLSQLSSLIRQAYDADNDFSSNVLVEQLLVENRSLREMLGIAEHVEARSSAATTYPVSQPHRGPPQRGFSVFSAPVRDYFANGEVEAQDGKAPQVATNGAAEPAGTMRGESVGM